MSRATKSVLFPKTQELDMRIRRVIVRHIPDSIEDKSAYIIQRAVRRFIASKWYRVFGRLMKHVRERHTRPYFNILLLNSHVSSVDRNAALAYVQKQLHFRLAVTTTPEQYACTGMMGISVSVNGDALASFVRKVGRNSMQEALDSWRVFARVNKKRRYLICNNCYDMLAQSQIGALYTAFHLWQKLVMPTTATSVFWDLRIKRIEAKKKKYRQAEGYYIDNVKARGVQALLVLVRSKKENAKSLIEADSYRNLHCMKFSLIAWLTYIMNQQAKTTNLSRVFQGWYTYHVRTSFVAEKLKVFAERRRYFMKRAILGIFVKNKDVTRKCRAYQAIKIQQNQTLALFAVAVLQNDEDHRLFYFAFHAWKKYIERRNNFVQYIANMHNNMAYDDVKKKVFKYLVRNEAPEQQIKEPFFTNKFRGQSLAFFKDSLLHRKPLVYLVHTKFYEVKREQYMKVWMHDVKRSPTYFKSLVYLYKKKSKARLQGDDQTESIIEKYNTIKAALDRVDIDALTEVVEENKKIVAANRSKCMLRDNMILMSYRSHNDALSFHRLHRGFTVLENDPIPSIKHEIERVNSLTEYVSKGNRSTSSISKPSVIYSIIYKIRADERKALEKLKSHLNFAGNYDRIVSYGVQDEGVATCTASYLTYSQYSNYPESRVPHLSTINKLLERFPLKNTRKMIRRTERHDDEEEEKYIPLTGSTRESSASIELSSDQLRKSMYFNSLASFRGMLSNATLTPVYSMDSIHESSEPLLDISEGPSRTSTALISPREMPDIPPTTSTSNVSSQALTPSDSVVLKDAFDIETDPKPLSTPKFADKQHIFLQLLFGRSWKEDNTNIQRMKRKLFTEFKQRSGAAARHGVVLTGVPLTSLLTEYRDAHAARKAEPEPEIHAKEIPPPENEVMVKYNSRRFRSFADSDSDSDDIFNNESLQSERPPFTTDETDETDDLDIDISEPDNKVQRQASRKAIDEVDKAVFKILQKNVLTSNIEQYVELGGEEEDTQKDVKPEVTPTKTTRLWTAPKFKPYEPRKFVKHEHQPQPKPGLRIIQPMKTKTPRVHMDEERNFGGLSFTKGTIYTRKSKLKPQPIIKEVRKISIGNGRPINTSFGLDGKVVSFGGNGRGIKEPRLNVDRKRPQTHLEPLDFSVHQIDINPKIIPKPHLADPEYHKMKSLMKQFVASVAAYHEDKFEKLRRRTKMIRYKPAFVGLKKNEKPKGDPYTLLQSALVQYTTSQDFNLACEALVNLGHTHTKYIPLIRKVVDNIADAIPKEKPPEPIVDFSWANLGWNVPPDYNAVGVQYRRGSEFSARISRAREERRPSNHPNVLRTPAEQKNWDEFLDKYSLQDLMLISSYVFDEAEIDRFIAEHNH